MLNPSQQEAVDHVHGPALVLAGAGAGKTSVLTQRVSQLLREGHVKPEEMLVVTFTNKAAREMKERLALMLGWKVVRKIWAGTFHSICCRILRKHIKALKLGYNTRFAIYTPKDQEKIMDLAIRGMNLDPKDYKASQMLSLVSKYKNTGFSPDDIPSHSVDDPFIIRVYRAYQEALILNNAVDFDDLIGLSLQLLRENEETRNALQQQFRQVLVDEYQDTNNVQFELIHLLGDYHRNVFVVGDVDQSIYSFRHANFRIILRFQEDYPEAKLIKLEENYRSTGHILEAANDLIQANSERFEKVLRSTRGKGEPIRFHQAADEMDESTYIVNQIKRIQENNGKPFGQFAILYRTNAQSRLYEQKLIQYNIPYHVVGGYRFYDRREIKILLGYLNFLNNPQDSLSLKQIINIPKRGIGAKAIETLETSATFEGRGLTLWEALQTERVRVQVPPRAQEGIAELISFFKQMMAQKLPMSELLTQVFIQSGFKAEIEKDEDAKKRENRLENVESFIQAATEYEENVEDKTDLSGFLEHIALFSDSDRKEQNKSVNLMTVHAAKGLEFPVVILPALEEGVFPHVRSLLDDNKEAAIEEERRLMYVAMTRAKDQLFITYATNRRNKRAAIHHRLSRFVYEIAHHMRIPGELLVEVKRHQYEERLKTNAKQGPGSDLGTPVPSSDPGNQPTAPKPSALPLHPMVEKLARQKYLSALQQQAGLTPAPRQVSPRSVSPPSPPQPPRLGAAAAHANDSLEAGDQVKHPQFGMGVIEKVIPPLMRIRFGDEVKTLMSASALQRVP